MIKRKDLYLASHISVCSCPMPHGCEFVSYVLSTMMSIPLDAGLASVKLLLDFVLVIVSDDRRFSKFCSSSCYLFSVA
jgi:hypothetical protein